MSFQQSPKPQQSHQPQSQSFDGRYSQEPQGYEDGSARMSSNLQGSSAAANEPSGFSRFLMFGLVVLALLASALMLFMDSDGWLKVALIAALWAAFFGVVLVLRYSGALKLAREQVENQESYFQSQLEQERAQLEKREAAAQAKYAAEAKKAQDQRDKHLEDLRAELAHMRKQLAELTGENFDEDEQRAVRATAERVRELEHSAGSQESQSAGQQGAQPHRAQHRSKPKFNTGTFAAVNWAGQDNEETSQLPLVVDTTAMDEAKRAEANRSAAGDKAAQSKAVQSTQPKPAQKRRAQMPSPEAVRSNRTRTANASTQEAGAQSTDVAQGGQAPAGQQAGAAENTHGRRRADEVENGLTVADLMKRFKQREK